MGELLKVEVAEGPPQLQEAKTEAAAAVAASEVVREGAEEEGGEEGEDGEEPISLQPLQPMQPSWQHSE